MKTSPSTNRQMIVNGVSSVCVSPLCHSSLQLFRQQQNDVLDVALRAFLVLCTVAALGIFGVKNNAADRATDSSLANLAPAVPQMSVLAVPAKACGALSTVAARTF